MAVTIMAIENKLKVPDMLILPYPAMTLSRGDIMPSIFYSLKDPILNISLLKMCFDSYVPEGSDPDNDYLISPLKTPELILARFPPIRIMVGTMDPIRDMSYLFLQK